LVPDACPEVVAHLLLVEREGPHRAQALAQSVEARLPCRLPDPEQPPAPASTKGEQPDQARHHDRHCYRTHPGSLGALRAEYPCTTSLSITLGATRSDLEPTRGARNTELNAPRNGPARPPVLPLRARWRA